MKNFEEKAIVDLSSVNGGAIDIYLTVKIKNLSEIVGGLNSDHIYLTGGISGVRDGIKGNTTIAFDIHKS
jgi:hypothetical protein